MNTGDPLWEWMEILEILQPVCYCMILLMSFYGRNADVLKVTSNKTIDDIMDTIENVGQSLFCELIRISINSLILSKMCDISLISSCLISLINHWKVIAAFIALYTAGFFNITDIRYWNTYLNFRKSVQSKSQKNSEK